MLRFVDYEVTFAEIPDEISFCINISNCSFHCKGCHSPWLWKDEGTELTVDVLSRLIRQATGISCICIMGGVEDEVVDLLQQTQNIFGKNNYKWAWYTGQEQVDQNTLTVLDYVKLGPWKEECGPLNKKTTNQRLYSVDHKAHNLTTDITFRFWESDVEH